MMKALTILCVFLAACQIMTAGRQFTHINSSGDQLSSDCIKALCQDSRGYIWIGTVNGVNRYDGTRIRTYSPEELGLKSNFITCIEEDLAGNVWVATSYGVSRYDFKRDCFFPLTTTDENGEGIVNMVNTMVCDPRGLMWFSVNKQGVFSYDTSSEKLRKHNLSFRRFAFAGDGRIWCGSYYSGLYITDPEVTTMESFSRFSDYFNGDQIQMLRFSSRDPSLLYVASLNKGLSIVNTLDYTVSHLCTLPKDANLNSAIMEDESRWWIATSDGVYCYNFSTGDLESIIHDDDKFSLSGNNTFSIMVDREGGLWVGTKDGGVDYSGTTHPLFTRVYETTDRTPLEKYLVGGFTETPDGTIWVATEQGGLLKYDKDTLLQVKSTDLPKNICSLAADGYNLWIGSLSGLFKMNALTGSVKAYGPLPTFDKLKDPRIYNVIKTSSGDIYATHTRGIVKYDPRSDSFRPVNSTRALFYTDIKESGTGTLYLSSFYDGVFEMDPASDRIIGSWDTDKGLGDIRVSSIFIDDTHDVWAIGFSSGFARLDREKNRFVGVNRSTHVSLSSDIFYSCVEDIHGRMWLTSDKGLVLYNPLTSEPTVYHVSDGILDEKFTRGVFRSSSSGKLYFGSDNGFIIVTPDWGEFAIETPQLAITEMRVGSSRILPSSHSIIDSNIDICRKVLLKPDQNSFAFSFASPGQYSRAPKFSQYQLEGYSDVWYTIPPDGNVILYNIPSGTYTLKIRTRSDSGEWAESHKPLTVVVGKRFFESLPGLIIIILCILLIIVAAILVFMRITEHHRQVSEAEYRKKKEEEMFYEKMNFFSHVVHEIKTPLTLIHTPLSEVLDKPDLPDDILYDLKVVSQNTEYLSDLVNELLEFVRVEKKGYTLTPIPINISERLGSLLFNYSDTIREKGINVDFDGASTPIWVSADSSALNKILNNLLLNAVKYAEKSISISISKGTDMTMTLLIANDGHTIPAAERDNIFKPFVRYSHSGGGFGIGLPLARSLAQMHSGSLVLLDSDQTCFALTLPLSGAPEKGRDEEGNMEGPEDKPVLLVVDDNGDLRNFLSRKLSDNYSVLAAGAAEEALRILHVKNIDLMITDISMSGMNGLELCSTIRSDIEISHLPIIVLSARTSVESKIQAMESGADLYVEKPFNMDFLRVSIGNILDRRSLMKKALTGGSVHTDIKLFGLPSRDSEFFRRFDQLIADNISSTELSNDFLASNLAVSEATLLRKIRKLLDTTPVDYIRTKRLNIAAARLKSGGVNISEIAYDLGFNTPSYFSKCFKDHFGCSPSEYTQSPSQPIS